MTHTPAQIMAMAMGVVAALVVAVTLIVISGSNRASLNADSTSQQITKEPPQPGVEATITSGDRTITKHWDTLDINLAPGESIDADMAPGSFDAEITLRFRPGPVRYAQIGAILQGGSVIIMRGDQVLLSDHADSSQPKVTLTTQPQRWFRRIEEVRYIFRSDQSDGAVRLQAIWQPEDASEPTVLGNSPPATQRAQRE